MVQKNYSYWFYPAIKEREENIELKTEQLIVRICSIFKITKEQIEYKTRLRKIVEPRQIAMFIMHKKYGMTSADTGVRFNKNHATVLSACNKISGIMEFDKEFKNLVRGLY